MNKFQYDRIAIVAAECRKTASTWRGAPFRALNGKLEPEEIRRQIRLFARCGLGGFFLHARTGLRTPYLSEKFFNAIKAAVDEAEKCGMQAWLSAGEEKRNILVIHAVESAWTLFHRNWRQNGKAQEFDCKFTCLSHKLLAEHLDFDYADEEILSRDRFRQQTESLRSLF